MELNFFNSLGSCCCQKIFMIKIGQTKGGIFYDKLGAEVGTETPINGALATFIDRSG